MHALQDKIVARLEQQLQKRFTPKAHAAIKLYCPATQNDLLALASKSNAQIYHHTSLSAAEAQSDLTICYGLLEQMTKTEAERWLAMQRNLWSREIALIIDSQAIDWGDETFIGLGFFRLCSDEQQTLWYYAIDNYNSKRQWNNNRYWANPQNFDKFRW